MKKQQQTTTTPEAFQPLEELIGRVKTAQATYATFSQEQVDKIFRAAALAANDARIRLARMAVEETGMGVLVANPLATVKKNKKFKQLSS